MSVAAYEKVALTTDAVKTAADLTVPAGTQRVQLQADGAGTARYTNDGTTAPNSSVGMILAANTPTPLILEMADVQNLKISAGTANTSLSIQYVK